MPTSTTSSSTERALGALLVGWLCLACTQPKDGQPCAGGPARTCPAGYACAPDGRCYDIGRRVPPGAGDVGEGGVPLDDGGSAVDASPAGAGGSGPGGESGGVLACVLGSAHIDHCHLQ